MTACLKCGAENAPTNERCVRCEMPLPGRGGTASLAGDAPRPVPPPAALPQQTLYGVAPGLAARAGAAARAPAIAPARPAPETPPAGAPKSPAAVQRTLFGVAPGTASPTRQGEKAGVVDPAARPEVAGQRTLMGVMPAELAKAIGAARRPGPAPEPPAPAHGPQDTAPFRPVRNPSTALGPAGSPGKNPGPPAAAGGNATWTSSASSNLPGDAPHPAAKDVAPHAGRNGLASTALENPGGAFGTEALELPGGPAALPDAGVARSPVVHAKTHLGVAIPGIAPLRPGANNAPAAPGTANGTMLEGTRLHPDNALHRSDATPSFVVPPRPRMPRSALVLLGSGVLLLLSAAAFALLWSGSKPLSALVSADAAGKDRIDLVCEDCLDGTLIRLGAASAEVRGRKAYLTPTEPLPLGENAVTFSIQRPGDQSADEVEVNLPPVEYRIRPDTTTLVGDQPSLTLSIQAIPGSQIQIAESPVTLDAAGRGDTRIDVGGQLRGPASEVATFEQAVPYVIKPPSGKQYNGELRVKIGVTPLVLEAPGSDTVTDLERFMLAGRTTKGAELWVAGNSIPVDDAGRFAQLMSIDSVGETNVTVRASQPGLAPRFVAFRLQRVKDLGLEATRLRQAAVPFAKVVKDVAGNVGQTVYVTGKVDEVRVDGHRTLVVLRADKDCQGRSCLARLVYGGLRKLQRGTQVTAIGRLQRAASAPAGEDAPEIEVSLLL
jgi:hypothetical protein